MAFGDLIESWPAPGAPGSIRAAATARGSNRLWLVDHKNTLVLGCDPRSLIVVAEVTGPAGVQSLIEGTGRALNDTQAGQTTVYLQTVARAAAEETNNDDALFSIDPSACIGEEWADGQLITTGDDCSVHTWSRVARERSWTEVASTQPVSVAVRARCWTTDGAHWYTVTKSGAVLKLEGPPQFQVVDSRELPVTDTVDGIACDGATLWVSVGNDTDRVYRLEIT